MTKNTYHKICKHIRGIIKNTIYENHVFTVGGCNRDIIMSRDPHDIDICIDLVDGGLNFAQFLYNLGYLKNEPALYPTYGTSSFVLTKFPNITIEAVMTRKEQYKNTDSRNPETVFGTIDEDALRRDLTINSIYYNISQKSYYDPNNGIRDINNKILQTPQNPEIIFEDDPLRILRVIRFKLKYPNFTISTSLSNTIIKKRHRLCILKQERITEEINKILQLPYMSSEKFSQALIEYKLPEYLFPEISSLFYTILKEKQNIGNISNFPISYYFAHIFSLADKHIFLSKSWNISQNAIDLATSMLKRMKYPNKTISEVLTYIDIWNKVVNELIQEKPDFLYIIRTISYYAHNKGIYMPTNVLLYIQNMITLLLHNNTLNKIFGHQILSYFNIQDEIKLCINGNDIKNYFNLPQSPLIKEYLNIAIDLILKYPEYNSPNILLKKLKIIMDTNEPKMPTVAYYMRFEDIVWRKQYIKFKEKILN